GSTGASCPCINPGRRDPVGARARPLRHRPQHRTADPLSLEHGLRRGALAVALFPAWGRDRDPDLAPDSAVECAAWTLAGPAVGGDRGSVAANHGCQRIPVTALERRGEVGLDLRDDADATIDQPAVELHQCGAGLDLGNGGRARIDAAYTDQ